MNEDIALIVGAARKQAISAISLFGASVDAYHPFDPQRQYTPKELEPYDAMADRYIRAVEAAIRFFRAYERYQFGETSDTLRDLLNRMEKLTLVSSVQLWIEMRDQRNRIVHAYLPEKRISTKMLSEEWRRNYSLSKTPVQRCLSTNDENQRRNTNHEQRPTNNDPLMKISPPHKEIEAFCERWNIAELALFGSVLNDTFGPSSDIDVLVTFSPGTKWGLFEHVEMQDELSAIFGRKVDLVNRRGIEMSRNPIRRKSILGSAEVIHVRA